MDGKDVNFPGISQAQQLYARNGAAAYLKPQYQGKHMKTENSLYNFYASNKIYSHPQAG